MTETLLLHIAKAATELGLSEYQVRKIIERGDLPSERIGNRTYIPADAVREYVESIGRAS